MMTILIFCVLVGEGWGYILDLPASFWVAPAARIGAREFFPEHVRVVMSKRKPKIQIGIVPITAQAISKTIESIPVEARLHDMDQFDRSIQRYTIGTLITNAYRKYLVSSTVIDSRLLRLLYRFATRTTRDDENNVRSMSDIIRLYRSRYPEENLDYLTPEYLAEWYDSLGGSRGYYFVTEPHLEAASNESSSPIYVQMPFFKWRRLVLATRKDRLIRTGYEN